MNKKQVILSLCASLLLVVIVSYQNCGPSRPIYTASSMKSINKSNPSSTDSTNGEQNSSNGRADGVNPANAKNDCLEGWNQTRKLKKAGDKNVYRISSMRKDQVSGTSESTTILTKQVDEVSDTHLKMTHFMEVNGKEEKPTTVSLTKDQMLKICEESTKKDTQNDDGTGYKTVETSSQKITVEAGTFDTTYIKMVKQKSKDFNGTSTIEMWTHKSIGEIKSVTKSSHITGDITFEEESTTELIEKNY